MLQTTCFGFHTSILSSPTTVRRIQWFNGQRVTGKCMNSPFKLLMKPRAALFDPCHDNPPIINRYWRQKLILTSAWPHILFSQQTLVPYSTLEHDVRRAAAHCPVKGRDANSMKYVFSKASVFQPCLHLVKQGFCINLGRRYVAEVLPVEFSDVCPL